MRKTFLRFEKPSKDLVSEVLGPFEYVQMTHEGLDVDGVPFGWFNGDTWKIYPEAFEKLEMYEVSEEVVSQLANHTWTDMVIFGR